MRITVAQSIDRNRGLCSRCEYFSARMFDNGDQWFMCRKDQRPLRKAVIECTDYSVKTNGLFSQAAWTININPETEVVEFRDASYRRFQVTDGKIAQIKDKDDDD